MLNTKPTLTSLILSWASEATFSKIPNLGASHQTQDPPRGPFGFSSSACLVVFKNLVTKIVILSSMKNLSSLLFLASGLKLFAWNLLALEWMKKNLLQKILILFSRHLKVKLRWVGRSFITKVAQKTLTLWVFPISFGFSSSLLGLPWLTGPWSFSSH